MTGTTSRTQVRNPGHPESMVTGRPGRPQGLLRNYGLSGSSLPPSAACGYLHGVVELDSL